MSTTVPQSLQQLYASVLSRVTEVTAVPVRPMLYCNRTECVDARAILVNLLLRSALTEREVARLTTLSPQCVNHLKSSFHLRLSRWSVSHAWRTLTAE